MITTSFAEYHSKRNPLERVHAAEEKQLQKHGPFHVHDQEADTDEHKAAIAMEALASELGGVLSQASFGGKHIQVVCGIGPKENFIFQDGEDQANFSKLSEQRKSDCQQEY